MTVKKEGRVPPYSLDSEKALLGAIMLRNDAINEIVDFIHGECFYFEKHRMIWEAIYELFDKREPIDLLTLSEKLDAAGIIDQIGGRSYLAEISNSVPSSANIKHYGDIVYRKFMFRQLIGAGEYLSVLGFEDPDDLENTIDRAEKKVFEVTNYSTGKSFTSIGSEIDEARERFAQLSSGSELRGIPSGFQPLDDLLSGFQKGDLIILAARPSVGKTALSLDIARQAAVNHKIPVGFFSLEMGSQQLIDRMLASQASVDSWKLRTGKVADDDDFTRIGEAIEVLREAPIYIDDQPGNNILAMRSVARKLKMEKDLGLIIVDYLQLMAPTNTKASDSMVQQVTEISRSLKHLARELEVPVIALSQLSRAVEQRGGKPRLSDLRDSGSIEQDADVVMFIHRERDEEEGGRMNATEILIEKHRNGPTGRVDLHFDTHKGKFLVMDDKHAGSDFGGEFDDDF